jgi:hypothetical protein
VPLPLAPALLAPDAPLEPALPPAPAPPATPVPALPAVLLLAPALLDPAPEEITMPAMPALLEVAPPPPLASVEGWSEPEAQLTTKPIHTDTDSNPRSERYSMSTDYHSHHAAPAKPWSNSEIYYQDHNPTARNVSIAPTRGERYAVPMLSTSKS